jgi:dUTP pyrophosphatase
MRIVLNHPNAIVPTRKTAGSVGYDLYSIGTFTLKAHSRKLIPTGIIIEFIHPYYGLIKSRSGLSVHNGIEAGAGVIDTDYRGEIHVLLHNFSNVDYEIIRGERIAQMLILIMNEVEFEVSQSADITERGFGGFGSTGRI